MAGRPYAPFIGPSEPLLDRKASAQRSINLYMVGIEGGGEDKQFILESAPGLEQMLNLASDSRGVCVAREQWYVIIGSALWLIDPVGDGFTLSTPLGYLSTSTGFVRMVEMRDMIVMVDGPNGYIFNLNTLVFSRITDPDWRGSDWVSTLDGYAIFSAPNTDQFYISALEDAATLDALDFSSADKNPDVIVTHRVVGSELLMLGKRSTEIYVNSGDPDFPFTRYNAAPIEVGVVGNRAAINAAQSLYWVGQTGRGVAYLYELQGHQPVRISTQAVEESLLTCTDLTQVTMWTYQAEGAEFVAVNGPGIATTWVFDVSTRKWHERCELIDGAYQALRVDQVVHYKDKLYATAGADVLRIMRDTYSILGGPLVRERTWPHLVTPSLEPVAYRGVELKCTTGHDATEDQITLEISNDGGYVWGPPLSRGLGAIGRRMQRIRWLMLGSSLDRVFRVRVSGAVPVTFHGCAIDA